MSFNTLSDLANVLEVVSKKMLKTIYIPIIYVYVSPIYLIIAFLPFIVPVENIYSYSICLIAGLIGATMLSIYVSLIIYMFDSHIEYSKYYYLSVRDIVVRISSDEEVSGFKELVEELSVLKKIGVEYSPALLIPAYVALLLIGEQLYVLALLVLYSTISSLVLNEVVKQCNNHVKLENAIDEKISKLLQLGEVKYSDNIRYSYIDILVSIVSLGALQPIYLSKIYSFYELHLSNHRSNYENIKKTLMKTIELTHR